MTVDVENDKPLRSALEQRTKWKIYFIHFKRELGIAIRRFEGLFSFGGQRRNENSRNLDFNSRVACLSARLPIFMSTFLTIVFQTWTVLLFFKNEQKWRSINIKVLRRLDGKLISLSDPQADGFFVLNSALPTGAGLIRYEFIYFTKLPIRKCLIF